MTGAEVGGRRRNRFVERFDLYGHAIDQLTNRGHRGGAPTTRSHKDLREGRSREHDPVVANERFTESAIRALMVSLAPVEEADQDTGIDDGQSHSSLKAARSPGA